MHARELAQLAAQVAMHAPVIIRGGRQLAAGSLEHYWTASKCRLDRWLHTLKTLGPTAEQACEPADDRWQVLIPLLEEVLVSETLTRVWTAVACHHDRLRGNLEIEPVVRSVFVGHLEARHRALTMLVFGRGLSAEQAVALNRVRRRVERWTDLLLAHIALEEEVAEFAFEPERVIDFAEDLREDHAGHQRSQRRGLLLASLKASFQQSISPAAPNADLNERIAGGVLACFDSELFDSTGQFQSMWQIRLAGVATDAQLMLADLMATSGGDHTNRRNHPRQKKRF